MFKKIVFLSLAITAALQAETITTTVESSPLVVESIPATAAPRTGYSLLSRPSHTYMMVGAYAPMLVPQGVMAIAPSVSVGQRLANAAHRWDYALGSALHPFYQIGYGQASYLYYPRITQGVFMGVGLRGGVIHLGKTVRQQVRSLVAQADIDMDVNLKSLTPYVDLPFIFGYQFTGADNPGFVEVQVTPLLNVTGSYGFSF